MSFQVPLSSSPLAPSTPGSQKRRPNPFDASNSLASNPSTTPAGPPPSSAGSFTPAGPPPSSVFGSSQLGSGKTLFKGKGKTSNSPARGLMDSSKVARYLDQSSNNFTFSNGTPSMSKNTFTLPSSSPPSRHILDEDPDDEEDEEEEDMEEYSEENDEQDFGAGEEQGTMELDPPAAKSSLFGSPVNERLTQSTISASHIPLTLSAVGETPSGTKRSRGGGMVPLTSPRNKRKKRKPEREPNAPSIAQDMSKRLGVAPLSEPDDLITGTEECVSTLYAAANDPNQDLEALSTVFSSTSERLCNLWTSIRDQDVTKNSWRDDVVLGIGPGESSPSAHSAIFLSTLLLSLHHPAAARGGQALAMSRLNRSVQSSMVPYSPDVPLNPTAYPKMLLDWLDKNHNPYNAIYSEVQNHRPNPTAHDFYWDMIYKLAIRGKFADLIVTLQNSDFRYARTAREDGHDREGYRGVQLENIKLVIAWATQVLRACPALTDDDWNVPGNAWIIFRKQVEKSMDNLTNFAEGHDKDLDPEEPSFEASSFGLRGSTNDLSRSSRRAESKVPWTVLQRLKTLYGIILGGSLETLSSSENWVEATIALTAWWGGDDDEEVAISSLAITRRSLRQSRSRGPRLVDADPRLAYRRRMASAFDRVTEEPVDDSEDPPMLPDTSKPLEVALSSIFEGDIDGVIGLLRAMSLPIADAVAEIAAYGGWLSLTLHDNIMEGFDEDDMDLLSFERSVRPESKPLITKVTIMKEYAEELFNRSEINGRRGVVAEGWEFSIAVLARLGAKKIKSSRKEIGKILQRLPLRSDARIDKILKVCRTYDMAKEGNSIVERYADSVLDQSDNYGTALIYYARAHSKKKIKDVLDLLISYSLVQSTAYPAPAALDSSLHSLVFAPKESLEHLALLDDDAAQILHQALTGYATMRRFYDLRDEEVNLPDGQEPTRGPITRKTAAANALLALINSAADNIHGGLYDEARGSVVHVDGLLSLLGEATIFVNQSPSLLTIPQAIALLKAIEDLSTVSSRIYAQCDAFLHSTLTHYHSNPTLASPRQMLKKQMSSMTSGSSFSLVGSSLLDEKLIDAMDTGESNALTKSDPLVGRGWDWREGMEEGSKGENVLRVLRLGLAREMAAHWIRGEGL